MVAGTSYLAELVQINDTLIWSHDRTDSFVEAVEILRRVTGARLAPAYLLDQPGDLLVLTTDDAQRAELGEAFATMPAHEHVRPPWINDEEWPVSAADHLQDEGWTSLPEDFRRWFGRWGVVVSIHADGRHLGAVLLCFDVPYRLTPRRAEFLAAAGRILGSAVYRWQVAGRERELGALEERRRLGDELHVDLSQQVATVGLQVGSMRLDASNRDLDRLSEDVEKLDELVGVLKRSLRHQMLGLRADAQLVDGGLLDQVRSHVDVFERQFGIETRLECSGDGAVDAVPLPVAAQLLRVLQEALANVHLHARARSVTVRLRSTTTHVRLEVEDDGNGFDPRSVPDSRLGVRIMSERMQQVDGSVHFARASSGGSRVIAEAPIRWVPAGRPRPVPAGA